MEKISLKEISQDQAARIMRAAGLTDPANHHTPESISRCGTAFEVSAPGGNLVGVLEKRGAQLWIHGAGALGGTSMAQLGFETVQAMADNAGCTSIAFQTARPGLVRIAKKQGYRITGFILEKTK